MNLISSSPIGITIDMARILRYDDAFFETQGDRQWVGCKICGHLLGIKEDDSWFDDDDSLKGQNLRYTLGPKEKRRHLVEVHNFRIVPGSAKAEFVVSKKRVMC